MQSALRYILRSASLVPTSKRSSQDWGFGWVSASAPALGPEWMNEPARSTAVSAMSAAVFTHAKTVPQRHRNGRPVVSLSHAVCGSAQRAQAQARAVQLPALAEQPVVPVISMAALHSCAVAFAKAAARMQCCAVLYAGTAGPLATGASAWRRVLEDGRTEERIGLQGTRCLHSALRHVACCLLSRWLYRIGHALPALSHHHRKCIPAARNKRKSAKRLSSAAHSVERLNTKHDEATV